MLARMTQTQNSIITELRIITRGFLKTAPANGLAAPKRAKAKVIVIWTATIPNTLRMKPI